MADRGIAGVLTTHYSPLMGDETAAWSVSTSEGVALDAEELPLVLAAHHARLMRGWREFTADQWDSASRNERWSVHETVRHVADAMERGAGAADGDDDVEFLDQFDPRSHRMHGSKAPTANLRRRPSSGSMSQLADSVTLSRLGLHPTTIHVRPRCTATRTGR